MDLIWFWRSLTKKDSIKSARYEFFSIPVLGRFFTDPDFWLIRIWTKKNKSDPDPEKNPDPKH